VKALGAEVALSGNASTCLCSVTGAGADCRRVGSG
jgi:hypothetical protein